jgi:hypothetical protein
MYAGGTPDGGYLLVVEIDTEDATDDPDAIYQVVTVSAGGTCTVSVPMTEEQVREATREAEF